MGAYIVPGLILVSFWQMLDQFMQPALHFFVSQERHHIFGLEYFCQRRKSFVT